MKIPWMKIAQVGAEFVWDFLTGKLEPKREKPVKGWTHAESEIKAKAQRCAGHESEPKCR
jgi:hypothetical protein